MNVVASGGTTLSIRFTVTDNRTVYIGGFNIHWSGRAGRPSFADHFDRDLAALKRQKVPLPGAGIAKQLASTTAL
jgi:hypothetical protein